MSGSLLIRRPAVALVLAAACWGSGIVLSKQAVAEIPPLALLPIQLAISVAFLLVATVRRGEHLPAGSRGRRLAMLGVLNPGLAYALSLLGLAQITASLSVLLWALEPVLILLLAWLVLRERLGTSLVVLSAVAVGGLVLYEPTASGALVGVLLTVAGVGCCAVYTVATRRWLPGMDSTLGVVAAQQAWALLFAVVLLGTAAAGGQAVMPPAISAGGAASTIASGLLYYGLAYWLYLSGLRHVPASIAAVSFYLIPVFGVAAASLVGERLDPARWVGAIVVVGAVAAIGVRSATGPAASPAASPAAASLTGASGPAPSSTAEAQ